MRPVARSQPARARGRFVGGADDACDFVDRGRGIFNDIDDVRVGGTPQHYVRWQTERDSPCS
jgi:hypothetical protein